MSSKGMIIFANRLVDRSKLLTAAFFFSNQFKLFLVLIAISTVNVANEFLKALFGAAIPLDAYFFVMWVLLVFLFKLAGRFSITVGLIFLLLCPLFLTFQASTLADQSANAAFFLIVLGFSQQMSEMFRSVGQKLG